MRSASLVLIAYAFTLVLGVIWPALPFGPFDPLRATPPDLVAVTAGYLGLTARRGLAGAVGASVICGYLADLLSGAPPGLLALVGGLTCVLGFLVQRRILVRGWAVLGFSAALGAVAALLALLVRMASGQALASGGRELSTLVLVGLTTALFGPLVLRLYRRVDAAFARTHREREHALEGLAP